MGTLAAPRASKVINVVAGTGTVFEEKNLLFKIVSLSLPLDFQKGRSLYFPKQGRLLFVCGIDLCVSRTQSSPARGLTSEILPHVDLSAPPVFIIGRLLKERNQGIPRSS